MSAGSRKLMNGTPSEPAEKPPLQLYLVRLSAPCRAVWLYLLQHNIAHVLIDVDFSQSEETLPDFLQKSRHQEVPVLVDGDVVVFEGPPIIRYLASQYTNNAGYGATITVKALCESLISWANSEIHRVTGYQYAYPQLLEKYQLPNQTANEILVESGIRQLTKHLERLENKYLNKQRYVCGDRITVADSYVATILIQAEWAGFKFTMWPKVEGWLRRVKAQDYWEDVHVQHNQFVQQLGNSNCHGD